MNSNRMIAMAVLSGVMIVVVVIIVFAEVFSATSSITVYEVTQNVTPGSPYSSSNVTAISIKGQPGEFNYWNYSPNNSRGYVFSHSMSKNDIVQADDVIAPSQAYAQVAINIKQSPNVSAGNSIDIYAVASGQGGTTSATGSSQLSAVPLLIGKNITIASGSAPGNVTILVPPSQAALWLEISTDTQDYDLYATTYPSGGTPPPIANQGPTDAISQLSSEVS